MRFTRSEAVEFLVGMGLPSSTKWDTERLQAKITNVQEWANSGPAPEGVTADTLGQILIALEGGNQIEVTNDSAITTEEGPEHVAPAPAKKSRKKKEGEQVSDSTTTVATDAPPSPTASKKGKKAKAATKTATKETSKRQGLSCVDAAYRVLKETKKELNAAELVELMAKKKYWSTPNGKTPHASVASRIYTEIDKKGDESRFKKVSRGKFAAV